MYFSKNLIVNKKGPCILDYKHNIGAKQQGPKPQTQRPESQTKRTYN